MTRVLAIVISGVALIALLLILISLYLYRLGVSRNKKEFLRTDPNMPQVEESAWEAAQRWYREQPFQDAEIESEEGLHLRGHFLEAEGATHKVAILAHGYSGEGEDMAAFAHFYHESGYHVLMPDNRGHGHSDGKYIGFGWHDRKDYLRWIDYVVKRIGEQAQIVLHGVSMGGGTVLMVSGEKLPEQVKCVISDCAYSSVTGILSYHLKMMFKLPSFPFIPLTSLICKLRAGYFFGEASAIRQVSRSCKPILLIHGDRDTFVPTKMVDQLYEAARSEKQKLIVRNARHGTSFITDPDGYRSAVMGFIGRYVV
ncbi:alpha/beta hydrolase [Cohnella nanjingensis]|uniref:Alpha/beta hydrolase n=1 Tax=Cohnella nanjingensis TaxID=1387779 RepID=A0A7X0RLQ7_9BACL|nr:alpha/beta hydrolase [Cohnella nanjingensis]MBB6669854.1 alpha/beta hydrolase [Cohnella nanjingensis]